VVLNRCIVLQYREYGVPWFHEKYCKEHLLELNRRPDSEGYAILRSEVYEELCSMVGGWRYVKENSYSQYYNHIDFELAFDQQGNPVDMFASNTPEVARRVAVLLHDRTEYTSDTRRLLGKQMMASKHLQLQGWQVIFVNPFSWSAMCMSETSARRSYLQQSLQASAS
jgi:FAST kinase-like protein, subdomain 2/RAP domain